MDVIRHADHRLSQEEITDWLRQLRGHPYSKASGFEVTAIFRMRVGKDENVYVAGVNVENVDHRLSTHAEEGAISAMTTAFGKKAEMVEGWVMGAPANLKQGSTDPLANNLVTCCGKCRQQLYGVSRENMPIHSVSLNGTVQSAEETKTLKELLPEAFTFDQFSPEKKADKDNASDAPLNFEEAKHRLYRTGPLSEKQIKEWLNKLESIDYATGTSQAVIVELSDKTFVAGVKVEEASYVDIDPMQSAMATAHALCGNTEKIAKIWTSSKARALGNAPQPAPLEEDMHRPLNLSAVQVATQFAAFNTVPVTLINTHGSRVIKLNDAAHYIPAIDDPIRKILPQTAIRA